MKKKPTEQQPDFVDVFKSTVLFLCRLPKDCSFTTTTGEKKTITICPHPMDYGTILGKPKDDPLPTFKRKLRTLEAFKVLFNRMAQINGLREGDVILTMETHHDGEESGQPVRPAIVPKSPKWNSAPVEALMVGLLPHLFVGEFWIGFETISPIESKMLVTINAEETEGMEAALEAVFSVAGNVTGKQLRLELMSAMQKERP